GAGGHLTGVLGERLLAVFGHPQAREDDARRATRAALRIIADVQRTSARLEDERRVRAVPRIGVHTGLVIVRELRGVGGRAPSDLLGPTPQVAALLEERATPGEVLVSADTHRLLRGVLYAEPAGTLRLSEHSAGMAFFRLGAGVGMTGSAGSVRPLEAPLVGRRLALA